MDIDSCHLLYESTFQTHAQGKAIDKIIDNEPTASNIGNLIELDELNRLAFMELEHYNKHAKFLFKHPRLQKNKLCNEFEILLENNPAAFMKKSGSFTQNISRYKSHIKQKKYKNKEELVQWENHIKAAEEKLEIMQVLISK